MPLTIGSSFCSHARAAFPTQQICDEVSIVSPRDALSQPFECRVFLVFFLLWLESFLSLFPARRGRRLCCFFPSPFSLSWTLKERNVSGLLGFIHPTRKDWPTIVSSFLSFSRSAWSFDFSLRRRISSSPQEVFSSLVLIVPFFSSVFVLVSSWRSRKSKKDCLCFKWRSFLAVRAVDSFYFSALLLHVFSVSPLPQSLSTGLHQNRPSAEKDVSFSSLSFCSPPGHLLSISTYPCTSSGVYI